MELEVLRGFWNKTSSPDGYFISTEKLRSLINKRSDTAVAEIKRRVRNKALISGSIGLFMIPFSVYAFTSDEVLFNFFDLLSNPNANSQIAGFYLVFGLVLCFISIFHIVSLQKIKEIESLDSDLKTSIRSILDILRRAMNVKIYSDTFVVPLTTLGFIISMIFTGGKSFPGITPILVIIGGAILFAVFSYFNTKRGQHKRYKYQINALESCLKELEES